MRILFIVFCVLGCTALCGLMIMLLFFGLKVNIGFKLPKGKTIPTEQFIPQTVYGWAAAMAAFGGFGLCIYGLMPRWYLSLPASLLFALGMNFIGVHCLSPLLKRFYFGKQPSPDELEGCDAIAAEFISGEGYGRCKVKYNGRSYSFDCISANHSDIEKNETVTVITGQDKLLFVQKKEEIYDILKEQEG